LPRFLRQTESKDPRLFFIELQKAPRPCEYSQLREKVQMPPQILRLRKPQQAWLATLRMTAHIDVNL
jgi:hypothetical protein